MTKKIAWDFVSTGGGDDDGPNNTKLEYFAGDHNYYLAREIIQNSLDARKDKNKVVTVVFNLEHFSHTNFPGYDQLLQILDKAKEYWNENEKAQNLLLSAIKCLTQSEIPFLRISDFNTTGLNGADDDKKGGWYSLVRSTGNSPKSVGGGSFGIGKGAPFAASELRIVFYATKNDSAISVFQGKAELVSYMDDGDVKRGVGSFGLGQKSVRELKQIPETFWRKIQGTDVIIAGYKNEKGWEDELIKSILRNFWYAIFKNELEVRIGKIEIRSINLEQFLTKYFLTEKYRDDVKPTGNPLQYYLAVNRGKQFPQKLPILGDCSFYFYETDEYLNHVAMMRKSHMVIFSRAFRFPGNYAGVFICDNERGDIELRKMEPPEHDEWDVNRNMVNGNAIYSEITSFIKECLEKSKIIRKTEYSEIPEMYKYLPDNEDGEIGEGLGQGAYTGNEGFDETSHMIQKKEAFEKPSIVSPQKISVLNKRIAIDDDDDDVVIVPPGPEIKKTRKKRKRNPINIHIRTYNSSQIGNRYEYTVVIKGPKTAKYDLKFFVVGEDLMDKLVIGKVSKIHGKELYHSGNYLHGVELEKDKEVRFSIETDSKFKNALKIEMNEIQ
jgi:hypothetical protein